MKKKKLLKTVLATALMWMGCAAGTWAATTNYTYKMSSAKSDWTGATNTHGDGVENYNGNDNAFTVGNVLYQTISDLPNGFYEVEFYAWENFSNWNDKANIGYGDDKAQVFANVSVEDIYVLKSTGGRNYNDANKYKLLTSVTDGTLVYGVKNIAAGGNWAVCKPISLTYLGTIIDDNSDLTSAISNPSFETGYLTGWTIPKYSSDTNVCTPDGNHTTTDADGTYIFNTWWQGVPLTQTIGNLPSGRYKLTASIASSDSGADAKIFLIGNGTHSDVITIPAGTSGTFHDYDYTFYLTGNSTTIGIVGGNDAGEYVADGHWWYKTDNFRLTYLGITVEVAAESLPTGNMTANKWYYFDALSAGDYIFSTVSNIVYTTDGTQLASSATTSTWTSTTQELTEGRYYVKSSSAQTLTVTPANYTYTVGSATSSHAYVQEGQTVTVTWSEAFTNNTSATFAKNGNPPITFNGTAVTVTTTTNGFTFTVPTGLTVNTNYTLSIPANAFGYAAGSTYNEAQNITIKTPALFDQTAFLKDNSSGLFLARGADWGTRAKLDEYGTATVITTDANGYTTFKFVDTDRYLYYDGSNNLYCDGNGSGDAYKWIVTLNDGKYRLTGKTKTTGTDYVKYDNGDNRYLLWANIANKSGENIVGWTPVNASDYGTLMTNKKNAQASTAASAAGLSATTPAELESAVSSWEQGKVIASTSTITTTAEKFKQGQTNPAPITIVSGEIEISTPGLYKFSMQAFYRMRGNNENYILHTDGFDSPAAYVFFGDAKTQIASVFDHAKSSAYSSQDYANSNYHYPNGQNSAKDAFQNSYYTNTVWKYVTQAEIDAATNGKFTYGIVYQGWPNYVSEWDNGTAKLGVDQWCCWAIESADLTLYAENNVDFVKDYVHYYYGTYATAPALEVTDAVPVVDVTNATFTSGTSTVTFTNPNGLVFVSVDGQTSATKNEVFGTTCASLQLEKGHPFINPKEFTATSAKYTLSSDELAGGSFATLMIPFAASTLAGTAYALDQDINLIDGNIYGTSTASIAANTPVLVTANGNYTGSSVTVPVVAAGATYTNGELVGTYTAIDAPESSYVLQNHTNGEGVAFYLVGLTKPTVNPFRAYIMAQSSNVRALQFLFDEETGIKTIDKGQLTKDNVAYDLQGRRISVPSVFSEHSVLPKGLYIVNGKKVVIK